MWFKMRCEKCQKYPMRQCRRNYPKNRNEKMNQETTRSGGGADTADVIQV
jgi:hypothetical protein